MQAGVFILALGPGLALAWGAYAGTLGANPVEAMELTTGIWAFRFLLLSLAVTPLRKFTGWNRVIRFRRTFGLVAFGYATLHLCIYLAIDQGLDLRFIASDVVKRRFITAGMTAYLLLIPLALTSTRGAIARLGRRWARIHRLVYVSAAAVALHFVWKVKVPMGEPVYYAAILALLLGIRVVWRVRPPASRGRQPAVA